MSKKNVPIVNLLGLRAQGDLGPLTMYDSRRNKRVWYIKAPPKKPPSRWQLNRRQLWHSIAWLWRELEETDRQQWLLIAQKGRLKMSGYALFVWWCDKGEVSYIRTIEKQTGLTLNLPNNPGFDAP